MTTPEKRSLRQTSFCLLLLMLVLPLAIQAQQQWRSTSPAFNYQDQIQKQFTTNGMFDTVADHYGNKYALKDLRLGSNKAFKKNTQPLNTAPPPKGYNPSQTNSIPTQSCVAGKFDLYFDPSGFFNNNTTAQTALCDVFKDISAFIVSSLPGTVRINILCGSTPNTPGLLGQAAPIFVYPNSPVSANPGVVYNQIQKALIMGIDPFANLPINIFPGANNFYYGYVNANPNVPWDFSTSTAIGATNQDFYSTMLHEITHSLGFMSLISSTGVSQFGALNNYYDPFDKFLYDMNNQPLLAATNCAGSDLAFQGPATKINPGSCSGSGQNNTNCSIAAKYLGSATSTVYTPNCWEQGSSLSHFEDICTYPTGFTPPGGCTASPGNNDAYFAMSNAGAIGPCGVKRFLRDEERKVLCDLGYGTLGSYSSMNYGGTSHTYPGGSCNGMSVYGIDDGYSGNIFTIVSGAGNSVVSINIGTDVTANDVGSPQVICAPEVVYGNATISSFVSNTSFNVNANSPGIGVVLLKYYPYDTGTSTFGNVTYIYVFFLPGNCSPPNPCDMIQNGGFENISSGSCGIANFGTGPVVSCWSAYDGNPDLLARGCTTQQFGSTGPFNLGTNTYGTNPIIDSYNGTPNDHVAEIGAQPYMSPNPWAQAWKNNLSSSLIPGTTYEVSFWVFNYSGIRYNPPYIMSGSFNPNQSPAVISIASSANYAVSGTGYPSGLNWICDFTIPYVTDPSGKPFWQYVQQTFVFSGTPHSTFFIGVDGPKTAALGYLSGMNDGVTCFIDDVSLKALPTPVSFVIPQANTCGNSSILNLGQYVNNAPGVFSGTGVTLSGGQYDFNASNTLPAGNYPIQFVYTAPNGCQITLSQNVLVVSPPGALSISASSTSYCANTGGTGVTLTAALSPSPSPALPYTWQPGNLTGASIVVTPSVPVIYTVSVTYTGSGGCVVSNTVLINGTVNCCSSYTSGMPVLTNADFVSGSTINGPGVIYGTVNTSGGIGAINMQYGEFLMAPGAKIIVMAGHDLFITKSHLYACGANMWQGIEVQDYARIISNNSGSSLSTLIEDAVVAIDFPGNTFTHPLPQIDLEGVVFNRNRTSIRISNGPNNWLPLRIVSSVFTCRNLPFTSTSWPGYTTSGTDLRVITSPTTGVQPPFSLQGYTPLNLKLPYAGQPAQTGIEITNMANVPGTGTYYGVEIGYTYGSTVSEFNVFDNLGYGFDVTDASLKTMNNMFQNMLQFTSATGNADGTGIRHTINGQMNAALYLTPYYSSFNGVANCFWDCYRGIDVTDVYELDVTDAVFRSTQNVANIGNYLPGNVGIKLNTNRFRYEITANQFNNLETGIDFFVKPGTWNMGWGNQPGVYADLTNLNQNYFGPEVASGNPVGANYFDKAINLRSTPTLNIFAVAPISIYSNKINRCYRGIFIEEMDAHAVNACGNLIELTDDNALWQSQYGIRAVNTKGTLSILENKVSAGPTGKTNNLVTAIHCKNNSGLNWPWLSCNEVYDSYNGFDFDGNNSSTIWMSNRMWNLFRGMCLSNFGVIGFQGSSTNPIDNEWLGAWFGGDLQTYVDNTSNALNSKLWVNPGPTTWPSINGANPGDYNQPLAINPAAGNNICVPSGMYPPVPTYRPAPVDIKENTQTTDIAYQIFPNPAERSLTIKYAGEVTSVHALITEVTGKILVDRDIEMRDHTGDLKFDLINGIYILEISSTDGLVSKHKLIIAKTDR
jgi:hypothetical protein